MVIGTCGTVILAAVKSLLGVTTAASAECLHALAFILDVHCEHGSSLHLALQLHWISEQEVLHPLSALRLAGLHRYFDKLCDSRFPSQLALRPSFSSLLVPVLRRVWPCSSLNSRCILALSFAFTLFFFGGFHVWMVLNDKTTLEVSLDCSRFFRGLPCVNSQQNYYRNWCSVMDESPWIVA